MRAAFVFLFVALLSCLRIISWCFSGHRAQNIAFLAVALVFMIVALPKCAEAFLLPLSYVLYVVPFIAYTCKFLLLEPICFKSSVNR